MLKMKSALAFAAMVVVQVAQVGLTLAAKTAIQTGMHNFSYIFYTNAIASLLLLPPSVFFFIYRSPNRPTLTISVASAFLGLGILGFLMQVVGYVGITYASATEATAILNLIPGFTFLFAIIFQVEKLGYGGLAKIIGTLVSVIGAVTVTLYTGPTIIPPPLSSQHLLGQSSDFILGGLLMLIDSILAALFINAQGLFGSGFQITIGAWCVKTKGPVFVAIFQPLGIVIAAILGVLFLGDGLYLGCLIGSAVIVIGFYGVMWGKSKEDKLTEAENSQSPLLQHNINDVMP